MKIVYYVSGIILATLLVSVVSAMDMSLDIKDNYEAGTTVTAMISIISNIDQNVTYSLGVKCPDAQVPFIKSEQIKLKANVPYKSSMDLLTISEEIEPQICIAGVIVEESQESLSKSFHIVTKPSLYFEIKFCKNPLCLEKSRIFTKGETVYLDFDSEVENPSVNVIITKPDKSKQKLTLPGSIAAEQIGTYEVKLTGSKKGYKTKEKEEMFAVIDKAPSITSVSICNADSTCSGKETPKNCPQDCKKGGLTGFFSKIVEFIERLFN